MSDDDARIVAVAERVCTPRQLEALRLKAAGYGAKRSAHVLGISPQAVAARLEGARRAIAAELED